MSASIPSSQPSTPGYRAEQPGFVGLGSMGYFMARNLAKSREAGSLPLLVFNRTRGRAETLLEELGERKIRIADDLQQVARECDIILTCLSSDDAVRCVYARFKEGLLTIQHGRPKVFVEMSTCHPSVAAHLDEEFTAFDHTHLITCPVFGPPTMAEKSQLVLIMSGDYASKRTAAHHLVPAIGRKVIDLGGNLMKAPTFKLIENSMVIGFMEVMAESLTLAEKVGIDADFVHEMVEDMFPAPMLLDFSNCMRNDQFNGIFGFALDGGLKDASHIRTLATEYNSAIPAIDVAHQSMRTARALHAIRKAEGRTEYDILDWTALVAGPRVASGLDAFSVAKHPRVMKED